MNRVWLSGKIVDVSISTTGERIYIMATLDAKPKLVLAKYRGNAIANVGDIIETSGELSEQEQVTVNGQIVTGPNGRVPMRNIYRITELALLAQSAQPTMPCNTNVPATGLVLAANLENYPSTVKENTDEYNGPEVPWA